MNTSIKYRNTKQTTSKRKKRAQERERTRSRCAKVNTKNEAFRSLKKDNQDIVELFGWIGLTLTEEERRFVSVRWINRKRKTDRWSRWKQYAKPDIASRINEFYYRFSANTISECQKNFCIENYKKWTPEQRICVEQHLNDHDSKNGHWKWGEVSKTLPWTTGIQLRNYCMKSGKYSRTYFLQNEANKAIQQEQKIVGVKRKRQKEQQQEEQEITKKRKVEGIYIFHEGPFSDLTDDFLEDPSDDCLNDLNDEWEIIQSQLTLIDPSMIVKLLTEEEETRYNENEDSMNLEEFLVSGLSNDSNDEFSELQEYEHSYDHLYHSDNEFNDIETRFSNSVHDLDDDLDIFGV